MLRSCRHHSVRFVGTFGHEVVNQNAYVRFVSAENERFFAVKTQACVQSRHKPLRRRFFIAAASVELSCKIQVFHDLAFKRGIKRQRVDAVVFYGVSVLCKSAMRKSGERSVHFFLHVVRERTAHALNIHFVAVQSFGFDENLVPFLVAETHDFVLNGRTVSGTYTADASVVKRTAVNVVEYDLVRAGIGIREITRFFFENRMRRHKGKSVRVFTALYLHFVKIDRFAVNSRRSSRLETPDGQTEFNQALRKPRCGSVARRSRTFGVLPDYDFAVEIYARCQHNRTRGDFFAVRKPHPASRPVFREHGYAFAFAHGEIGRGTQNLHHFDLIKFLVLLSAQRKHRGTFCRIQHFDLNERPVRDKSHFAAERVYFAHKMTFRRATYRRVARHHRNRAEIEAQHKSAVSRPCRCKRGFDTCVSAAYDYDIEFFHNLPKTYFPCGFRTLYTVRSAAALPQNFCFICPRRTC